MDVPPLQPVVLNRPHARIWRQLHSNIITLVKHSPSIEQVLYGNFTAACAAHTTAEISNFRSVANAYSNLKGFDGIRLLHRNIGVFRTVRRFLYRSRRRVWELAQVKSHNC